MIPPTFFAYFDTNVFDHVLNKKAGVNDATAIQLRAVVTAGRICVLSNILNIQETVGAMHSSRPEVAIPQLALIASLYSWDRFVKPHDLLLTHDIRHFVWNGEADTPFLREDIVRQLRSATQNLLDGKGDLDVLDDTIREDTRQKKRFVEGVAIAQQETSQQVEELRAKGELPTFEEYLKNGGEFFARAVAESVGLAKECEQRGLFGLLKMPSVRAMVGLSMSFIYRTAVENRRPRGSASRDLQHAVAAAAAADFFVTHDKELAILLGRVPISGFKVVTLRELLIEVSQPA